MSAESDKEKMVLVEQLNQLSVQIGQGQDNSEELTIARQGGFNICSLMYAVFKETFNILLF